MHICPAIRDDIMKYVKKKVLDLKDLQNNNNLTAHGKGSLFQLENILKLAGEPHE